ncbi:hypothetical protein NIES2101_43590 [Calothrix sp. HK-06]|nr:hypothetical protein NIES2101_43590 [Calothrix sp. HK-06]
MNEENFLCSKRSYYSQIKPGGLIFYSNLKKITHKVTVINNLEALGEITSQEASEKIKRLWRSLNRTKKLRLSKKGSKIYTLKMSHLVSQIKNKNSHVYMYNNFLQTITFILLEAVEYLN